MSMLRLAVVTMAVTFLNSSVNAQNSACDFSCPTPCNQGFGGRCGLGLGLGFGCGMGCGMGCGNKNGRCLTAEELWAGFETSQNCQGCVKQNRLRMRGFGFPAARFNEMAQNQGAVQSTKFVSNSNLKVPVPSISVNWPKPVQLVQSPQKFQMARGNGLGTLAMGKQKNVRSDIPNDNYGRLGESRSALANRPSAVNRQSPSYKNGNNESLLAPPKPVVEPIESLSDELPAIENAQKTQKGNESQNR